MWILLWQNFHNRKFIACLILICIVTSCRQCDDIQAHNRSSYSDLKRDQSIWKVWCAVKTVLEIESIILFLLVVTLTYKYVRVLLVERKKCMEGSKWCCHVTEWRFSCIQICILKLFIVFHVMAILQFLAVVLYFPKCPIRLQLP